MLVIKHETRKHVTTNNKWKISTKLLWGNWRILRILFFYHFNRHLHFIMITFFLKIWCILPILWKSSCEQIQEIILCPSGIKLFKITWSTSRSQSLHTSFIIASHPVKIKNSNTQPSPLCLTMQWKVSIHILQNESFISIYVTLIWTTTSFACISYSCIQTLWNLNKPSKRCKPERTSIGQLLIKLLVHLKMDSSTELSFNLDEQGEEHYGEKHKKKEKGSGTIW